MGRSLSAWLSCVLILLLLPGLPVAVSGVTPKPDAVGSNQAQVAASAQDAAQESCRSGDDNTVTCSVAVQVSAEHLETASEGEADDGSSSAPTGPAAAAPDCIGCTVARNGSGNSSGGNASHSALSHAAERAALGSEVRAHQEPEQADSSPDCQGEECSASLVLMASPADASSESLNPAAPASPASATPAATEQVPAPSAGVSDAVIDGGASSGGADSSSSAVQPERKRLPTMIPGLDEFTLHDTAPQPSAKDFGVTAAQLADAAVASGAGWAGGPGMGDEGLAPATPSPIPMHGSDQQEALAPSGAPAAAPAGAASMPVPVASVLPDEEDLEEGRRINLADADAGASVVAVNKEAKYPDQAIDSDEDSYMKNVCASSKWLILELSQLGRVDQVVLTMKEMYSSRVREFSVKGRQSHPKRDGLTDYTKGFALDAWQLIGNFTAANIKGTQSFTAPTRLRVRYVLFQFLTHYGNEEVCALNRLQVLGMSAAQELEAALSRQLEASEPPPHQRPPPAPSSPAAQSAPSQTQPLAPPATSEPSGAGVSNASGTSHNETLSTGGEAASDSADAASSDDETEEGAHGHASGQQHPLQQAQQQDVRLTTTHVLTKLLPGKLLSRMGLTLQGDVCRDSSTCQNGVSASAASHSGTDSKEEASRQVQDGDSHPQQPPHPSTPTPVGPEVDVIASGGQQVDVAIGDPDSAAGARHAEDGHAGPPTPVSAAQSSIGTQEEAEVESGAEAGQASGVWQQPTARPDDTVVLSPGGGVPQPQQHPPGPVVVPLAAMGPTSGPMGARDLENLILALGSGPSNRHRPAGNLFDVFKQEFMMLKLNQTRMAKYMSQVVELLNKNTADMLGEVQDLEERLAAAKTKAEQAQAKATEAAAALVAAAEQRWDARHAALEQELSGRLGRVAAELQAARTREVALWGCCVLLLLLNAVVITCWSTAAAAPAPMGATGIPAKPATPAASTSKSSTQQLSTLQQHASSSGRQSANGSAQTNSKGGAYNPQGKEAQRRLSEGGGQRSSGGVASSQPPPGMGQRAAASSSAGKRPLSLVASLLLAILVSLCLCTVVLLHSGTRRDAVLSQVHACLQSVSHWLVRGFVASEV